MGKEKKTFHITVYRPYYSTKIKKQRLKSNILAHLKTIFARIGYFFKSKNMVIVIVSCLHFNGGELNTINRFRFLFPKHYL